ncbi:oligosaccharide flippase family protein [Isoptericola sp. b441]|uniref:Oligosaccharide flippase family protein n=1 Tax=Actinotalea lenta TaxID=3064654 RepID=A0ABT9D5F5_9CELL|nr:oligosaccharide flippase family protein [Isoptericola sp. b441]MDO8106006.1 oligosaccharide flippase family protein [Isoptericola sp. b441]
MSGGPGALTDPEEVRVDGPADEARGSTARSEHSGLFGRGLLYVVVMATPLVSATVISPILTRLLGPGDFGLVSAAISLNQLLVAAALVGLDQAVMVQRAEDGNSTTSRGLVATGFVTSAAVMGLAAATAPWWGPAFGFGDSSDVVWLTLAWTAPAAPVLMMATLLLAENRLRPFALLSLVSTTGGQITALVFLLVGKPTAALYLEAAVAITLVSVVLGLVLTRPRWTGILDRAATVRALRLGVPMTMNAVAGYVLNAGDRILIQRTLGPVEVGRYQVAYTIGYVVVVLMYYVNQSWTPRFAELRDPHARLALQGTARNSLYRMLAPTVLGISLAAPVALRVFAPASYEPGTLAIVVVLIAVSAFPVAAGGASGRELLTLRRGRAIATSTVVAAVANIALNLVLLPRWGILGAAVATLLSFSLQSAIKVAVLPREPRWPRTPWRLWALVGASGAVAAASTLVPDTTVLMGIRFVLGAACLPWLVVELRRARLV